MFYDNLKKICDEKGLKVTPTVLKCGGSKGSLTAWKNGAMPNSDIVVSLSVFLKVPTDILLLGKEKSQQLNGDEQKLLDNYKKLPPKEKIRLVSRAETLAEVYKERAPEPDIIPLPCSENRVSAGTGEELYDYEQWDTVDVIETPQSHKADFMLIIEGDSMEPTFHNGDYILVRQQPAVEMGQIGIFYVNGKGYIKKYAGDRLISLNPKYDDIPLADMESRCFGLVLGVAELA